MSDRPMKMMSLAAALFVAAGLLCIGTAGADSTSLLRAVKNDWTKCRYATQAMERMADIPSGLLTSISLVESGRRAPSGKPEAWPWTINAEGRGYYFASKEEAIRAARRLKAAGTNSIDVGCMQINLRFHPRAFTSLEEAFDPSANVAYAAQFLGNLRASSGSWTKASGNYHSYSPSLNKRYAARVQKVWASEKNRAPLEEALFIDPAPAAPELSAHQAEDKAHESTKAAKNETNLRLRAALDHDDFANTRLAAAEPARTAPALRMNGVYAKEDSRLPEVIVPRKNRAPRTGQLARHYLAQHHLAKQHLALAE